MNGPAESARTGQRWDLELIALVHAGLLVIVASWAFGGNSDWARRLLSILGAFGFVITGLEFWRRRRQPRDSFSAFRWLWPLLAFDLLVIVSAFHPSFRLLHVEGTDVYVPQFGSSGWPTSARPGETLQALWLFNALFIPCFNLTIAVRSRSRLRALLFAVAANSVLLAVFGTLQKLTHAPGLFFGLVPSPNAHFFASFIYPNHWGAFAVLMASLILGLLFSTSAERGRYRGFFHSPAFAGAIACLILVAAIPLSRSRSATALAAFLVLISVGHALKRLWRTSSRRPGSAIAATAGLVLCVVIATAGSVYLAKTDVLARTADTREQLTHMRQTGSIGARAELYTDTWRMARDRIVFGWGLASYPTVFVLYNRQTAIDGLPVYFEDAHSDWLQSAAEVGLAGTLFRGLLILLPLAAVWRSRPVSPRTAYPLLGCGLLLLYAWVEFPFGNAAVTSAFWLCFFAAVRLSLLEARERSR